MNTRSHHRFPVTIAETLSWESQVVQYPALGPDGISYYRGDIKNNEHVDCLLYRTNGEVVGILNHYPFTNEWEKKGNVNIFVHPHHRRQGIGTALYRAARKRWTIRLDQQRFSAEGAALAASLERTSHEA